MGCPKSQEQIKKPKYNRHLPFTSKERTPISNITWARASYHQLIQRSKQSTTTRKHCKNFNSQTISPVLNNITHNKPQTKPLPKLTLRIAFRTSIRFSDFFSSSSLSRR